MDNRYSKEMITINDKYTRFIRYMYQNALNIGAVIGGIEQYYNKMIFQIKELWIDNAFLGSGLGMQQLKELEEQLKERGVNEIVLFIAIYKEKQR